MAEKLTAQKILDYQFKKGQPITPLEFKQRGREMVERFGLKDREAIDLMTGHNELEILAKYEGIPAENITVSEGEEMRDLFADLEICNLATQGPWESIPDIRPGIAQRGHYCNRSDLGGYFGGGHLGTLDKYENNMNDADFIAAARTGWIHSIKRAITAESKVSELVNLLRSVQWSGKKSRETFEDVCPMCKAPKTGRGHYAGCPFGDI